MAVVVTKFSLQRYSLPVYSHGTIGGGRIRVVFLSLYGSTQLATCGRVGCLPKRPVPGIRIPAALGAFKRVFFSSRTASVVCGVWLCGACAVPCRVCGASVLSDVWWALWRLL